MNSQSSTAGSRPLAGASSSAAYSARISQQQRRNEQRGDAEADGDLQREEAEDRHAASAPQPPSGSSARGVACGASQPILASGSASVVGR